MLIKDLKVLKALLNPVRTYNFEQFKPIRKFSLDSRLLKKGEAFIAIKGVHYNGHNFILEAIKKGAGLIIAEKPIVTKAKVPFLVVGNSYCALGAIANYIRKTKNPFVYGITGSVGKTTTKEMLYYLLKDKFKVLKNKGTENNFLGVAKTILSLNNQKVMILEFGTSLKGEIKSLARMSNPDVGIVTFIKPVHLKGLKNLPGIYQEKTSLFRVNPQIQPVLNRDDPYLAKFKAKTKVLWFGRGINNNLSARMITRSKNHSIFLIQEKYKLALPTYLEGFIANAQASILAAHLLGIPLRSLVERMNQFKNPLPMRMEARRQKGFLIINDAYNANPYSFSQAFKVLENYSLNKIAVVGQMLELGPKSAYYHRQLARQIVAGKFEYCLMLGKLTLHLKDSLTKLGYRNALVFSSPQEVSRFIADKFSSKKGLKKRYLIFLKGSRKMELEKVVDYL